MLKEFPVLSSSPASDFGKPKLGFHGQINIMTHTDYF